ncbi:MAG: YhbY family RNA-binding protein [Evtepia gabavorous]
MELTSKQRAQLRGMANGLDTIVQIGKDGIGDNLVQQANEALEARELIKCRVLESYAHRPGGRKSWPNAPEAKACRSLGPNLYFIERAIAERKKTRSCW